MLKYLLSILLILSAVIFSQAQSVQYILPITLKGKSQSIALHSSQETAPIFFFLDKKSIQAYRLNEKGEIVDQFKDSRSKYIGAASTARIIGSLKTASDTYAVFLFADDGKRQYIRSIEVNLASKSFTLATPLPNTKKEIILDGFANKNQFYVLAATKGSDVFRMYVFSDYKTYQTKECILDSHRGAEPNKSWSEVLPSEWGAVTHRIENELWIHPYHGSKKIKYAVSENSDRLNLFFEVGVNTYYNSISLSKGDLQESRMFPASEGAKKSISTVCGDIVYKFDWKKEAASLSMYSLKSGEMLSSKVVISSTEFEKAQTVGLQVKGVGTTVSQNIWRDPSMVLNQMGKGDLSIHVKKLQENQVEIFLGQTSYNASGLKIPISGLNLTIPYRLGVLYCISVWNSNPIEYVNEYEVEDKMLERFETVIKAKGYKQSLCVFKTNGKWQVGIYIGDRQKTHFMVSSIF